MFFTLSRLSNEDEFQAISSPWLDQTDDETKYKCVFAHTTNGPYLLHAYVNKPSKKLIFDLSQNAETVIRLVWRENIDDFSKIAIDDSKYYSESQFARDKGSRLFSSMVINLTNGQKKYLLEFDETDPVNPRNNLFEVIQQNRYFDLDYVKDKNEGFNYFLELDNKTNERIKVD